MRAVSCRDAGRTEELTELCGKGVCGPPCYEASGGTIQAGFVGARDANDALQQARPSDPFHLQTEFSPLVWRVSSLTSPLACLASPLVSLCLVFEHHCLL